MTTSYFVVTAPGHYQDRTRVKSSHRSLAAAHKAKGWGECVREGGLKKGDEFLRVYEQNHVRVEADGSRHGVP